MELTNDSPLNSRKKKWKFYDDLSYLRPHCEMFRLDPNETAGTMVSVRAKRERREYDTSEKSASDTEIVTDDVGIQVVVEKQGDQETTEYTVSIPHGCFFL